jgi:hypothetical protein
MDATIVGSLELYRHHLQVFNDEMENRYNNFATRLSDFLVLYGQMKA